MTDTPDIEELFQDPFMKIVPLSEIRMGKVIGTGASGSVYAGTLGPDRPVAIKKVNINIAEDKAELQSFINEIKIMNSIAHPNVLPLIAVALSNDLNDVMLVTPLIEGGSLADALFKRHQKFTFDQKVDIVRQIAYGMHHLHSMRPRIIHRDLKPDNVLLTPDREVKIADFGLSKMIQKKAKTMTTSGTPHYMAPEVISSGKTSEYSDVYSYGIILWEVYSEKRTYENVKHAFQIMYQVVSENLRPVIPVDCPKMYAELISSCLKHVPKERPSFKAIVESLKLL